MMQDAPTIVKQDVYSPYAALECSKHFPLLYSGKGASLCVHSLEGELLHACQPFDAQNIHGIRELGTVDSDSIDLLVFSDKYIRHLLLRYDAGIVSVEVVNRFKLFDDFIWNCTFLEGKQHLVVGYAHNRVEVYRISERNSSDGNGLDGLELIGDAICTPQCVLYCMNLCVTSNTSCAGGQTRMLVASGTCFHDVTIWNITNNKDVEVKCVLRGHNGVVFRMRLCEDTMRLLTVSDDRTARLWSVESGEELTVFWGHTDRVWDAIFCGEYIVTSSEDSTVKIWKLDGTCLATMCGHSDDAWRLAMRQLPDGEHIVYSAGADGSIKVWPVEYHLQNSAQVPTMASVALPELPAPTNLPDVGTVQEGTEARKDEEQTEVEVCGVEGEGMEDDPSQQSDSDKNNIKQKKKKKKKSGSTAHRQSTVCSIRISPDTSEMVVSINNGAVWRCRSTGSLHDMQYSWQDVSPRLHAEAAPLCEPIGAFNVSWTEQLGMAAHPSGVVSLCSLESGAIVHQWQPHARRTLNLWPFSFECSGASQGAPLLVTSSSDSTCAVWVLREQRPELLVVMQMEQGDDATAACVVDEQLIVGDKNGNVHLLDLRQVEAATTVAPHQTLRRVHGREIVASIVSLPASNAGVASVGHDGDLVLYTCHSRRLRVCDRLTAHPISIPEVVWALGDALVVGGWHGSQFMVWDIVQRYQFLKVEGGSWRRCHASSLSGNPAFPLPFFVCSLPRKTEMSLSIHRLAGRQLGVPSRYCFHSSGHGKPVLCSVWLSDAVPNQGGHSAVVTAGQDGRVLCWRTARHGENGELLQLVQPLAGHITIMRALAVSDPVGATGVLVAGGGKLSFNVWHYQPDLHGERQFHLVTQYCLWKKATQDHRIFCLQAIPYPTRPGTGERSPDDYWLIAGDSRSMLTVCQLSTATATCRHVSELSVDGYPLLCCRTLLLSDADATVVVTVVGTTNGDLHLAQCGSWVQQLEDGVQEDFGCRLLHSFTPHQMGANCVDMRVSAGGRDENCVFWLLTIVSGGDDQAIAVTQARLSVDLRSSKVSCQHMFTEVVTDSAGSALKSVVLTQQGDHCVSVGYDQRLTVWELRLPASASHKTEEYGDLSVQKRYRHTRRSDSACLRYTTAAVVNVGDISGLSLSADANEERDPMNNTVRALVTGQGMQLAHISCQPSSSR